MLDDKNLKMFSLKEKKGNKAVQKVDTAVNETVKVSRDVMDNECGTSAFENPSVDSSLLLRRHIHNMFDNSTSINLNSFLETNFGCAVHYVNTKSKKDKKNAVDAGEVFSFSIEGTKNKKNYTKDHGSYVKISDNSNVINENKKNVQSAGASYVKNGQDDSNNDSESNLIQNVWGDYVKNSIVQIENAIEEHTCGQLNNVCKYCGGLYFSDEVNTRGEFKNCCHFGKVKLQQKQEYPEYLKSLFNNSNFKSNIRSYNSALSFASMGAQIQTMTNGPYCFKIHGQVYHNTYNVGSENINNCKYSQLYVIDTSEACDIRLNNIANKDCNKTVMEKIDKVIRDINPYAKIYKTMAMLEKEHRQKGTFKDNISMVFNANISRNANRYNTPTANEIAMVFTDPNGEPPFRRDIRVYAKKSTNDNISLSILSPHIDPMTYVLFYPYGESGWQPNLFLASYHNTMHKVSMLQYKVAQIAIRHSEFNPILHGGKLFQQWITDTYLQVEANNLNFLRQNQKSLRIEQYKGLIDYLNMNNNENIGRSVILPSTFQGSPRNMRERYHDAMAIVTKYGKPDLFITMTCNPNWKEIRDNLLSGQQPCDRPDLIARVFKLKLNALLNDIIKNKRLGEVLAHVYTIEFQKRGLPHAHTLIILKEKIDSVEKIDRIVSAEIPSNNDALKSLVLKHMIHGPCGYANPNAPCMENDICTKEFPKEINNVTRITDGYPVYRRRHIPSIQHKNFAVNNTHVVPYNKYLLQRYNCHINVEVCTSIKSVKYIFKYIYKGYDCASIHMYNNNEINQYINTRYIAAPEAMWRLLEYRMHDKSHNIIRLPVHLPREQMIIYEEGHERDAALNETLQKTQLLAWFKLNQVYEKARNYLYTEIPLHYVYTKDEWKKRQRCQAKVIARLYSVSPNEKERFYLRILLLNVKGATSYNDLKTFKGITYDTFELSARERNLLIDDNEWINVLDEAVSTQTPSVIRQLFAYICIFNKPNNTDKLFHKYVEDMSEDITGVANKVNEVLIKLKSVFDVHNQALSNYNLPEPTNVSSENITETIDIDQLNENISRLNKGQKEAFDKIIDSIDKDGRLLFIDGPAGSGKTYIYKVIIDYIKSIDKVVLPFATTGIAADLLSGAKTVHSGFKLPVPLFENSVSRIKEGSKEAKLLEKSSLILIDEVSMLSKYALNAIDEVLRRITKNDNIFGGKTVLLGGDFRQTANVVMRGTRNDIVETSIINSDLWKNVSIIRLSENMRSIGQEEFAEWLLNIGNGNINDENDMVNIPERYIEKDNIVNSIFGEGSIDTNDETLYDKIILTSKNDDAVKLNALIIDKVNGNLRTYKSIDTIVSEDNNDHINYPMEFINKQQPSGMPPHILKLKVGTVVMLLRNLDQNNGLLNGTRMIVEELHDHYIICKTLTGIKKGRIVAIPRTDLAPSETSLPFVLKRRQFPIIPAFAMTIHKSQDQSFGSVGVFLKEPLFTHGQLYVALSRVRNAINLKIYLPFNSNGKTKNVVYKELIE